MNKIPKKIHYCWFGGNPLPKETVEYIKSWKKYCPDYEIIEWNESNFDINCCQYVKEAYDNKKWAFVSDYARFWALFNIGGVYLDTDIEILKNFDDLLNNSAFFGFGNESLTLPVFGAQKGTQLFKDILEDYSKRKFVKSNGQFDTTTIERTAQRILIDKYNLKMNWQHQVLKDDIAIYPKEYFCSTDWQTGIISKNPNLYVIHYADGSWMSDEQKLEYSIKRKTIKIFGKNLGNNIGTAIVLVKQKGLSSMVGPIKRLIKKSIYKILMKIFWCFAGKNNKVVMQNFAGKGYGDNPKYIAKALIDSDDQYDLVWIVNDIHKYKFPKEIRVVKKGTLKEIFELATAKFWIDNNRKPYYLYKNPKQKYIQTWHGFYPFKKMEKDAEDSLGIDYVRDAMHDGEITDLMVSGCRIRTQLYKESFWYKGEVLNCGTPRNDIFFSGKDYKNIVYNKLGINKNYNTILYCPTFRDNHSIKAYDLDFDMVLKALKTKFGGGWCFLIRLHPAVRERSKELKLTERCIDVSSYDDIQELFVAADAMITDYSDCMFEFSLTRKPVWIYASDCEEYIGQRDFYYNIHDLPFNISENNSSVINGILNYDDETYRKKIDEFFIKIECYENGTASQAVAKYIKSNV